MMAANGGTMAAKALKWAVALVVLAAGLALVFGFDRMGHRAEVLGLPVWLRIPAGLVQVAGAVLLVWPGRMGYGAGLILLASGAAVLTHAAVLGWDSAPPAMALLAVSALWTWRNRADFRR